MYHYPQFAPQRKPQREALWRESDDYKAVCRQRTATERINSQALELGIERPKLRNEAAIINQNTLTYVLIRQRRARPASGAGAQGRVGPAGAAHERQMTVPGQGEPSLS